MKANSDKSKQSKKATRRVLAGVLCGASVLSLVLSLVMPPISQAIANDAQTVSAEETVMGGGSSGESTGVDNTTNEDAENQNSDDAENEANEETVAPDSTADDAEAEGAAQPSDAQTSDDENSDENAIAPASVSDDDYDKVNGDVSGKFDNGGKFQLTGPAYSSQQIDIKKNTTINLAGNMLYNRSGGLDSFFVVENGVTLTIENIIEGSDSTKDEKTPVDNAPAGQPAIMTWERGDESSSNNGAPKSLTYYETKSTPNTDGLCTTETTYRHDVTGFGAIVAASDHGSVKQVVTVNEGGMLDLKGGMITTAANLSDNGHVILSTGKVKIEGGYVTNGNRGGWGGGLCITGANASLEMTDGVVAGNKAASGGGVYADNGATLKLTGGIISGNATYGEADGLGGGILVSGGSVTVSGGYITNNKYAKFCGHDGWGNHGGAGLAANNGAHVTISGGKITGNYSEEAGGGVYVTNQDQSGMAWLDITGGIIASNVSYRSEGAGIRVGQQVDAMINGTPNSKVYITHNRCMSRFDWGGGGIFVQGNSNEGMEKTAGRLFVYNSYISSNTAGGYGGGVAVCPTGKTLVTNTEGTAIFGNSSADSDQNFKEYNRVDGSGNDGTPHLSAGGAEGTNKTEDRDAYDSETFRTYGHADFFLAATGRTTPVAVVSGKMLGDIDAKYSGSIELNDPITIPANGVAQVKNSIGLTSAVSATDKAVTEAVQKNKVTTFITDNYSWNHGGGIMSNGDLYLGQPADTYVYPSLKLKATKALSGRKINKGEFSFTVYRKDSVDPFASGVFNHDVCTPVGTASNVDGGNITFNLGEQSAANGTAGTITYYLVENAGKVSGITYDPAVYEIKVTVEDHSTVLMTVPTRNDPNKTIEIKIHNYEIKNVSAVEHSEGKTDHRNADVQLDAIGGYYSIDGPDGGKTFTNKYTPSVSWTPMATKIVEGGEMKKFTLQLATDSRFRDTDIIGTAETTSGKDTKQTLSFKDATDKDKTIEFKYSLSDIRNNSDDPGGSTGGSFKTFTYYVREKTNGSQFSHYTYDQSVYKFTVVPTYDTEKGEINCRVTYMKGSVDSKGDWTADPNAKERTFIDTSAPKSTDTSIPTFTNTYSTSLPLSGMSGVTLTYLAGAAVLCAAAAWMHIRRKANAKGGKRRE
ncbi:hypothetical protein KSY88_00190 [Collinsella aerofaciens]|uniref:Spy0128 family protein n=1 Tax=Collinsella aerofaciens TaxID=74426 RepID=UPI001C38C81D|nr:FctA domain-containing protein [Collinsella aerofaciens]MBV4180707.1 hypothetical protein [Collinsella aerofaciens]MBV4192731.1 hypothetical protein [Collinsella aerofaciens]